MRKLLVRSVLVLMAIQATAWAGGTVVVAPARISVIQVGMDLAARYGVTLVSYQGEATTAKPLIHVWNGKEWEFVGLDAFQAGTFLPAQPAQTLIIGDEKLVPDVFAPMSAWAGKLQKIPNLDTPDILNAVGAPLKFRAEDWQWFSARYNMKAEDINAEVRKGTVYDHKIGDPVKLRRREAAQPPAIIEPAEPKKPAKKSARKVDAAAPAVK